MKYFIVHAHHEPKSFNSAMTALAQQELTKAGHEVVVSDLYAMGFDAISDRRNFTTTADAERLKQQQEEMHANEHNGFAPDVAAELDKLDWCDVLVFQFPLWWFGLPAILKGWVDRVFAMGRVYGGGRWYDKGVFAGKRAMVSVSTGGGPSLYAADGINGDMETILFPINHGMFAFTGFTVVPPFVVWSPVRIEAEEREGYLQSYIDRLLTIADVEPIAYPAVADFDPKTLRRITPEPS